MTDQRGSDPNPDSVPEHDSDVAPDSPPAAQDDAARTEADQHAATRTAGADADAADEGAAGDRSSGSAPFADVDLAPGADSDPLID
ncbi:hypothetical protein [Sphingomonas sp. TZW2008]|uniref:hypothetical protein n=1 Tax=Sphingomonas sp. TZW2008 TaxID=1917973 RepID=UPI000A26CFD7|nr:hypothetical protein [Sphingomonas sp. TZW2008]